MTSPYVRRLRLAAELRKLRERACVAAQVLAKRSEVYRQMVSELENADVPLSSPLGKGDMKVISATLDH